MLLGRRRTSLGGGPKTDASRWTQQQSRGTSTRRLVPQLTTDRRQLDLMAVSEAS